MTYVAYYGDRDEMEWVQGAPEGKEYSWCHKFATVVIVGENTHYVVGVCPLGSTDYAATDAIPARIVPTTLGMLHDNFSRSPKTMSTSGWCMPIVNFTL